jgi:cytoskeleton protein RodZ
MSESALTTSERTPGQRLRQAREALTWSIDDVAAKLKLKPRQVQAMEADAYGELPGATFVRGFMRNYAKLVQIDPEQLLDGLQGEAARDGATVSAPHEHIPYVERPYRKSNRALLGAAAAILVVVIGLLTLWRWEGSPQQAGSQVVSSSDVPAASPAPVASTPQGVSAPNEPAPASILPPSGNGATQIASPDVKPDATAASSDQAARPSTDAGGKPESISPQTDAAPAKASVKLNFDATSWVQVRDGKGKVIFTRTGQPGGEHEFTAALPLKFIIGNAAKVKMTYNGEPFDLMSRLDGTVARFTVE